MNRDSKGRFCREDEVWEFENSKKERWTEIHEDLMSGPGVSLIENEHDDGKFKYTIGVKVVAFYDVDVRANSPEEAIEKISEMSSYKLLTENIPVDSRDPVFSWLALQDE
jgi:hypothetical protein